MALQPRHRWLAMRVLEYYRITDATVVEEAFREDAAFKLLSEFLGGTLNAVFISYSLERVVDPVRSPKNTGTTTPDHHHHPTSVHAVSNLHPQPTTHSAHSTRWDHSLQQTAVTTMTMNECLASKSSMACKVP